MVLSLDEAKSPLVLKNYDKLSQSSILMLSNFYTKFLYPTYHNAVATLMMQLRLAASSIEYTLYCLQGKVFEHDLGSPRSRPIDFKINSFATGFGILLLLIVLGFSLSTIRRRPRLVNSQDLSLPLDALMTLVSPTTSLWPPTYLRAARRGGQAHQQVLVISLQSLQDDCISDAVELRSSPSKLPDLILDTLQHRGWRVRLHVDAAWRLRVFAHTLKAYLPCLIPRVSHLQLELRIHAWESTIERLLPLMTSCYHFYIVFWS